jgi:putative hydrolases of HD superfamily
MATPARNVLCFARLCGALKNVKRTGWVNNKINEPESVADHMYRMSMLAFMIQDPAIKKDHLIKLCLVHDLAEAIVGDITPYDEQINAAQKQSLEIVSSATLIIVISIFLCCSLVYDRQ